MVRRKSEVVIGAVAAGMLLAAQPASAQGGSAGQQERPSQGGSVGTATEGGGRAGAATQGGGTDAQAKGMRHGMSSQRHVAGKVASVDAGQKEITLETGEKLRLTGDAKVLQGRKQSSLDAVKPGDRVRASLDAQGQVQSVVVMHAGSRPAASPVRERQRTPGQASPAAPEPGSAGQATPSPQR